MILYRTPREATRDARNTSTSEGKRFNVVEVEAKKGKVYTIEEVE